ncbi:MAG: YabP/YqfC family sporulation protein [Eubacteriales bacterium]|nr:YabP/YqfC family sporulation protein [Eubacteriales bacterium]
MNKCRELPAELCDRLELPAEIVPGTGSVTVSGGRRALIEGHRGILAFSEDQVAVSFGRQTLTLSGSGLRLEAMNGAELRVVGRIHTADWS